MLSGVFVVVETTWPAKEALPGGKGDEWVGIATRVANGEDTGCDGGVWQADTIINVIAYRNKRTYINLRIIAPNPL
ncbi:hypothetical protein [Candidatus Hadarchaeum sp.]|uniref:hypothetical protein n=1 Tax=Candidatus Hadarchaeum sp. TaxID=2883567 RepID=UPI00319EA9E3